MVPNASQGHFDPRIQVPLVNTEPRPPESGLSALLNRLPRAVQQFLQTQQVSNQEYANLYDRYQRENHVRVRLQEDYEREKEWVERLQRQNENLKQQCEAVTKWAQELQAHNEEFRTQVVSMEKGRGPIRDEHFYIQSFEGLKRLIEQRVLKLSQTHNNHSLSEPVQADILKRISELGPHGKSSAEVLKSEHHALQKLYNVSRWRHSLIRHIVALYLLDRVFQPFAFGLSQEFSDGLKSIETDVMSRGLAL
jgi:myosin heavy subunit